MNMICLRMLFFASLAVMEPDYVRAKIHWNIPVEFHYTYGDILDLKILLHHVPPVAKYYYLQFKTDNCDANNRAVKNNRQGSPCEETGRRHPIPKDGLIPITQKLNRGSLTIYLVIVNNNYICSKIRIMSGIRDAYAANVVNTFADCLHNYRGSCEIIVDLKDTCNDIHCKITQSRGFLECESSVMMLLDDTVHQWYQIYNEGNSFIGAIPTVKGIKTKFKMDYYKFDYNTYIYSIISSRHWNTDLMTKIYQIPPRNKYEKYHVTSVKTYSESEKVNFTCLNKAHMQVGWIDPVGYKIITYNVTWHTLTFGQHYNNSIWCCIHYISNKYRHETTVERVVEDMTLLIYKEPGEATQHPGKANTPHKGNKSQDALLAQTPSSSPEPETPRSPTPADTTQNQHRRELTDNIKYYIGITTVAGIMILILLIYVLIKKCYGKSYDPEETLQLETYASTNEVLYAELDIGPGNSPPPPSSDDPTYAKIIGEIRPQNQNDKK